MLLILDSNEYIFALGSVRDPVCEKLLDAIAKNSDKVCLRVTRLILKEVRNNLTPEAFKEFILFLNKTTIIDDDSEIPFELGAKYEARGLKPADAFIAAHTEWTGSEILVSENRHFLTRHDNLPFRVLTAEKCLHLIKHL